MSSPEADNPAQEPNNGAHPLHEPVRLVYSRRVKRVRRRTGRARNNARAEWLTVYRCPVCGWEVVHRDGSTLCRGGNGGAA